MLRLFILMVVAIGGFVLARSVPNFLKGLADESCLECVDDIMEAQEQCSVRGNISDRICISLESFIDYLGLLYHYSKLFK